MLEGPAPAHLVTLEADGRPQVSIVWVSVDGEEIVAAHLLEHRKVRNIRRDPRVALTVVAGSRNETGLDEYVAIRGRARITDDEPRSFEQCRRAAILGAHFERKRDGDDQTT